MVSYSIWEPGRDLETGRFSSMVPRACPSESFLITNVPLGIEAVAALGMFGAWYEQRQEPEQAHAQWEEPRVRSLDQILDQWISGHRDTPGVALEATQELGREAEKLLGDLVEGIHVDVPSAVTLKLGHVVDYIDQLSAFWGTVLSALVEISQSDKAWSVALRPSREIAQEIVRSGMDEATYEKPNWWQEALGAGSLTMPIVGPILAGSSAGWLIAHLQDRRQHRELMKRLADYSELVSLYVAKNQLLVVATMVTRFLEAQSLGTNTALYARSVFPGKSMVLLGPKTARRWYAKLFTRAWERRLVGLAAPEAG